MKVEDSRSVERTYCGKWSSNAVMPVMIRQLALSAERPPLRKYSLSTVVQDSQSADNTPVAGKWKAPTSEKVHVYPSDASQALEEEKRVLQRLTRQTHAKDVPGKPSTYNQP